MTAPGEVEVVQADAAERWPVEPASVACSVFSPPYNAGIGFDRSPLYIAQANDRLSQLTMFGATA